MNKQDIIRMAREKANSILLDLIGKPEWDKGCTEQHLIDFAALIASRVAAAAVEQERKEFAVHAIDIARKAIEEEREACAKLADEHGTYSGEEIAKDIRSRGSAT
jgi:hypothetical protein